MTTLFHFADVVKPVSFGRGILPPAAPRRRRPVIEIRGIPYAVEPLAPGEDATAAYRLSKLAGDGAVYDVQRTRYGLVECDCGDYLFRRKGLTAEPCKHGRALVDAGLLDAPEPIAEPTPSCWCPRPYTAADAAEWAELSNLPALCGGSPAPAEEWGPEWDDWRWAITPDGVDIDETYAEFVTFLADGDAMTHEEVDYEARPDVDAPDACDGEGCDHCGNLMGHPA